MRYFDVLLHINFCLQQRILHLFSDRAVLDDELSYPLWLECRLIEVVDVSWFVLKHRCTILVIVTFSFPLLLRLAFVEIRHQLIVC